MAETVILNGESPEIKYLCKKDKRLAKLISMVGDISYTTHDENWYSFMVHEIIEQGSFPAGVSVPHNREEGTAPINSL